VQSSSATTGIVVVMASQGFITLEAGIAVALGANIGTCATAMLATLGKTRPAKRAAIVHVLFNILGALIWLGFIDNLAAIAQSLSPQYPELIGFDRLSAETPRQIANANTLFNLFNTFLFIGFTGPLGMMVNRMLPDRPEPERIIIRPRFLDNQLVTTPSLALDLARLEVGHLGDQILNMMLLAQEGMQKRDMQTFLELEKQDDAADILHAEINGYLSRVGKQPLTDEESSEFFRINKSNAYLESIGDVLETDLVALGRAWVEKDLQASDTMRSLLNELFEGVYRAVECSVNAVKNNDQTSAQETIAMKGEINRRVNAALKRQVQSLAESSETRLDTLNAEFELTDKLKRIYTLSKRIAKLWAPKEV
jgi:phosphate:Na+ symporter